MKLLIVNDAGITGGGTENRISTLMDYFIRNKTFQEIHVIQQRSNKRSLKDKRVKIHYSPAGYFKTYFFTKSIIKKYKIDFVQAHNMVALTPIPVLAAKNLKKPVVWYAHDYWAMCAHRNFINPYNAMQEKLCGKAYGKKCRNCGGSLKSSLKLWLWKRTLNKADLTIGTGRKLVSLYENEGILKGKWGVVVPWIDPIMLSKTKARAKRGRNILFVGSLLDFKGAWVAVKALKYVLKKFPNICLVFIGGEQEKNSKYRKKIEAIARQDNVLRSIVFAGKKDRNEIKKELTKAAVYVCPTVCMESFGLNWAEAMASGCPVIASQIGCIPEYINIENKNGILFKPRNYEDLAEKIIGVLKNKKLSQSIGKKGVKYAYENFDIEKSGRKILHLYKKLYKDTQNK